MTREEFTSRIERAITDEQYAIVEKVYLYHPSIDAVKGKGQIAYLYDTFGMRVILDMLPTAEKAKDLERQMRILREELASVKRQYEELQM